MLLMNWFGWLVLGFVSLSGFLYLSWAFRYYRVDEDDFREALRLDFDDL
ncbi:hypothetical protein TBCH5v1_2380 [Thermococcus barophilus]|uniref:Uncharacterized protein n=1 Tax=Thermococcus barophilus TaxID=55802 RepID=A0A0S1XET6_THEBA|nr:hypothetical protein TBCH5v1_2380 [Thermococcus barophilus]